MKSTACKAVIFFFIAIATQNSTWADVLLAHLQKADNEVTLQCLRRSEGDLKSANQTQGEQFEYRCRDAAGRVIAQGRFDFISPHFHNGLLQKDLMADSQSILLQIPWDDQFDTFECDLLEKQILFAPIAPYLRAAMTIRPRAEQPQAVKILDNGPDEKRLVWVMAGEGYTADEQDKYRKDVEEAVQRIFTFEPWSAYRSLINVYYINNAISNESGIGLISPRDSLFGLYYYFGVNGRLIWSPNASRIITQFMTQYSPGGFDLGLVICNDASAVGGSGGQFPIFNLHRLSTEIAVHETGHSFAFLADEYVDEANASSYPYNPAYPNVMKLDASELPSVKPEDIRWGIWVEPDVAFPGVGRNGIGLVEGALYRALGYYRPTESCAMRSLQGDFCPICLEAHVVRLYDFVSPLNSTRPVENRVHITDFEPKLFSVDLNQNEKRSVAAHWFVNDQAAGEGGAFVLNPALYNRQTVEIKVMVRDETQWVRQDPFLDGSYNPYTSQGVHRATENKIQVEHKWTVRIDLEPVAVLEWEIY